MKIFENIHFILIAALVFGVPVAATTRVPGQEFSFLECLKQAGVAAAIILILLLANALVARSIRARQRRTKPDGAPDAR